MGRLIPLTSAPGPDSDETARQAAVLKFLLLAHGAIAIFGAGFAVVFVIPRTSLGLSILAANLAALGSLYLIAQRGGLRLASLGYAAYSWLSLSLMAFVSGGIYSPVMPFYLAGTVCTGVLLGTAWASGYAILSVATVLGFNWLSAGGAILPMIVPPSPPTRWSLLVIAMACTLAPVHVAIATASRALKRAREELAERMITEDRLRQSEANYRDIVESIGDAFYRADEAGLLIMANQSFARLLGYSSVDECLGRSLAETFYFTPEDRQKSLAALYQTGHISNYEVTLKHRGGSPVHVSGSCRVRRDSHGRRIGVEGILRDITEAKKAREALARSEAKFATIFRTAPYSIGIARLSDGALLDVNPAFETRSGFKHSEVAGKTALELGLWKNREEGLQALHEAKTGQYVLAREAQFRRKDGIVRTGLMSICPIDILGEVAILFTIEDITEYKRAEKELRDKEALERFASVLASDFTYSMEVMPGGKTVFERISDSATGITGYALADLSVPRFWGSLVHPDDLVMVHKHHVQHVAGIRTPPFETRLRTKSGYWIWVKWCVEPIWNEDHSQVLRLLGSAQDVTRRKNAELAADQQRLRMEGIVAAALDGIIMIDAQRRIVVFNPAAERIFLWRADQIGQQPLARLIPKRFQAACLSMIEEFAADGTAIHSSRRLDLPYAQKSTGEEFPVEAFLSCVDLDSGPVLIVTCRDISERTQAEEARLRLEAQLRQAQKMEAIGTLAGGIAHDFNNILSAVIGYTEVAHIDLTGNDSVRESLDQVLIAAHRAKDMVQQILAFSRQQKHERHPILLQPVIREVLKLLRSTLPATIEIAAELSPEAGPVLANATQIHQILVNLAANAAHAMRGRPGRLEIVLAPCSTPDPTDGSVNASRRTVTLSVSDSGHGMTHDTLRRIFEPFFTTKPPGEGTGLGLSVVHGIIEEHQGKIQVASEPGNGTTFEILLPVHDAAAIQQEVEPSQLACGSGESVLVIDDELALCQLVEKFLRRLNYFSASHTDPIRALEEIRASPRRYDLVIADLTMPKITGLDLAAEIFRLRPGMPIVLMSGFNSHWDSESLQKIGIRDVLLKPISLRTFAQTLHTVLAAPRSVQ